LGKRRFGVCVGVREREACCTGFSKIIKKNPREPLKKGGNIERMLLIQGFRNYKAELLGNAWSNINRDGASIGMLAMTSRFYYC